MARKSLVITGTSPAAQTTGAVLTKGASSASDTTVLGLAEFTTLSLHALLVGATGGTLDVVIQSTLDGGSTWFDVAHFPQLAAGAGAIRYMAVLNRFPAGTPAIRVVNTTDVVPALAANSIVSEGFGDGIRIVCVAGAATSAGAALTFNILAQSEPF